MTFVSKAALKNPALAKLRLTKPLVAVKNTRKIGKKDMKLNDATPKIDVDPETYAVRADGELLVCEPATRAAAGAALFPVLRPMCCDDPRTSQPRRGAGRGAVAAVRAAPEEPVAARAFRRARKSG